MVSAVSPPLLSVAAAATAAIAALAGMVLARGSTAVPAAAWAVAAAVAYGVESWVRARGGLEDMATAASVRLVVVALSLCPIMALLGAKRPQHGVWQFIVATLAAVLAMPAASAALVRPGSPPDVHPLERWLVLVLAGVAGMNFLATRHAVAAGLVVGGQLLLARSFLPFGATAFPSVTTDTIAAWLVAAGAMLAAVQSWAWPIRGRARRADSRASASGGALAAIDAGFLPLRETLGAAWTLRIMERFNAEAASRGWPCRLHFDGVHAAGEPSDSSGDQSNEASGQEEPWQADALRTARALARRFVSPGWLARHDADR